MGKVSVVIPVRNGEDHVVEAVTSALSQGTDVIEVIVVDDGSSDRTVEYVRQITDSRVKLVTDRPSTQAGVSAVRNFGFSKATGDWITFLDADDRLRPGAVAALLAGTRNKHPAKGDEEVVATYGDYERIDEAGRVVGRRHLLRSRAKPSGPILKHLLAGNFIVNGGVMLIRADAFRMLGGFDEGLRYCEDWHAWCRLAALGEIRFLQGVQVLDYRVHNASTMMARKLTLADYQPALDAIFNDPRIAMALPAEERKQLHNKAAAHLNAYLIAQSVRGRRYGAALVALAQTMARRPRDLPRALLVSGAALVGI